MDQPPPPPRRPDHPDPLPPRQPGQEHLIVEQPFAADGQVEAFPLPLMHRRDYMPAITELG